MKTLLVSMTSLAFVCLSPAILSMADASELNLKYELLLRNGTVVDGTGGPVFRADVGILGGRIVDVGRLKQGDAKETVDATGMTISPGFIDLHSHAASALASSDAQRRAAPNLVTQGITTVAINPDGGGPV